ncbi:hypothetical protein EVAR_28366_1 [Eumeta japonica]|uniref:Uncharacterized protein n=1 Tax=Eumeta variegata TaxID=151549 RepID=A0A4C1ZT76_EUMVA|nr:hypothetical protein EVAR_28366_1 [Eumeta japonica]
MMLRKFDKTSAYSSRERPTPRLERRPVPVLRNPSVQIMRGLRNARSLNSTFRRRASIKSVDRFDPVIMTIESDSIFSIRWTVKQ